MRRSAGHKSEGRTCPHRQAHAGVRGTEVRPIRARATQAGTRRSAGHRSEGNKSEGRRGGEDKSGGQTGRHTQERGP